MFNRDSWCEIAGILPVPDQANLRLVCKWFAQIIRAPKNSVGPRIWQTLSWWLSLDVKQRIFHAFAMNRAYLSPPLKNKAQILEAAKGIDCRNGNMSILESHFTKFDISPADLLCKDHDEYPGAYQLISEIVALAPKLCTEEELRKANGGVYDNIEYIAIADKHECYEKFQMNGAKPLCRAGAIEIAKRVCQHEKPPHYRIIHEVEITESKRSAIVAEMFLRRWKDTTISLNQMIRARRFHPCMFKDKYAEQIRIDINNIPTWFAEQANAEQAETCFTDRYLLKGCYVLKSESIKLLATKYPEVFASIDPAKRFQLVTEGGLPETVDYHGPICIFDAKILTQLIGRGFDPQNTKFGPFPRIKVVKVVLAHLDSEPATKVANMLFLFACGHGRQTLIKFLLDKATDFAGGLALAYPKLPGQIIGEIAAKLIARVPDPSQAAGPCIGKASDELILALSAAKQQVIYKCIRSEVIKDIRLKIACIRLLNGEFRDKLYSVMENDDLAEIIINGLPIDHKIIPYLSKVWDNPQIVNIMIRANIATLLAIDWPEVPLSRDLCRILITRWAPYAEGNENMVWRVLAKFPIDEAKDICNFSNQRHSRFGFDEDKYKRAIELLNSKNTSLVSENASRTEDDTKNKNAISREKRDDSGDSDDQQCEDEERPRKNSATSDED